MSFTKVDPAKVRVWQLRNLSGAGKGSKNARIEIIEAQTLSELPENLKKDIKTQAERILEALKK